MPTSSAACLPPRQSQTVPPDRLGLSVHRPRPDWHDYCFASQVEVLLPNLGLGDKRESPNAASNDEDGDGLDLTGIPEFVAVADAGSLTEAASRLRLAKSTVSARIVSLERRLGARLLIRSTRQVALTEVGRVYHDHCVRLLARARLGEEAVQEFGSEPRGRLRVTCTAGFAANHIVPCLGAFRDTYPEIVPELIIDDRPTDLVAENIDVAIRFGPMVNANMVVRRLSRLRALVVAAPAYIEKHGALSDPRELESRDCLVLTPYGWADRWPLVNRTTGERREIPVRALSWLDSGLVALSATLAGVGISMLVTPLCGPYLRDGALVNILPDWVPDLRDGETSDREVCIVYPDNRMIPLKVRAFVDFLTERIGNPPSWDATA